MTVRSIRLEINVQDLAGNESDPIRITNVLFDTTPPVFTQTAPDTGAALNHQAVSYDISENLHQGAIIWNVSGGIEDPDAPHIVELTEAELEFGFHDSITLTNMPPASRWWHLFYIIYRFGPRR